MSCQAMVYIGIKINDFNDIPEPYFSQIPAILLNKQIEDYWDDEFKALEGARFPADPPITLERINGNGERVGVSVDFKIIDDVDSGVSICSPPTLFACALTWHTTPGGFLDGELEPGDLLAVDCVALEQYRRAIERALPGAEVWLAQECA